ncbi:MAG TPA: hypothetical protein VGM86_14305 [Thermoanaerobaculia bacterium]|jgi:hypothetical protein
MRKSAKSRVLLLTLAAFTTLLALNPPKPAKACFSNEVDLCYQRSTRTNCTVSTCSSFNTCDGSQTSCVYWKTVWCC